MSENIKRNTKTYKKGDENQIMKLMKYYSQQNKRLQEMEYNNVDEDTSLLHDNHQVEVQLFEDNVTQRKQRLQNVHKSMETVKSIYEKIHEVATQQVDQMFTIEDNYTYAENKTQKASQELVKAQQSQKQKQDIGLQQYAFQLQLLDQCLLNDVFIRVILYQVKI